MHCWVVVVDDDLLCLTNAKDILTEEGMRVCIMRSGQDLLKFMTKNTPDLILLDVMMPQMDGFQTYHALRKFEEDSGRIKTPVIFLTGSEDSEKENQGLEIGASDFIHKPFNKDILVRRIYNSVKNAKVIESLKDEASYDHLTGFLSRAAGTSRIAEYCASKEGVMVILDLDNFKLVNDLHGHDMGDRVLRTFADIVRNNIRRGDVVTRVGGDEFTAFFCNLSDDNSIAALIHRLNEQLLAEVSELLGGSLDIPLGISMGAVLVPEYGREYEKLFALADKALYQAKHNGKRSYTLYSHEVVSSTAMENSLQQEMNRVLQIVDERNERDGAMMLSIDQFSTIYRFIKRYYVRFGGKVSSFLFVLSGDDPESLKQATAQFGECLNRTLGRSDLIVQNKPNQFFLLLPELSEHDSAAVMSRIMESWKKCPHDDSIHIEKMIAPMAYNKKVN
ncbi:MAG: diguanylate cyclase [Succinivibrio sp.]|nr:diguanylate cyclase [Succinivibrio sp.]